MSNRYRSTFQVLTLAALIISSMGVAAGERGAVTAIASLGSQTAAFVGFSKGAVLYCNRKGGCTVMEGTGTSAVTAIDTPREGASVKAWVGYEDGSIYFCTLTGQCVLQEMDWQVPGSARAK